MCASTDTRPDLFVAIERVDTFLAHVAGCHSAGLSWFGLTVAIEHVTDPSRAFDAPRLLGTPRPGDRRAMRDDLNGLRRLLGGTAAALRFSGKHDPVLLSIADGMLMARGAMAVTDMRSRMHAEILVRLRRFRRDVVRRLDAIGSVDIRLDTWSTVGDVHRTGVRAYLEDVLQQQADYASFGRGNLGRLVEARHLFDDAIERVEGLMCGERRTRRRTDSGPITLARLTEQTLPAAAADEPAMSTRA